MEMGVDFNDSSTCVAKLYGEKRRHRDYKAIAVYLATNLIKKLRTLLLKIYEA